MGYFGPLMRLQTKIVIQQYPLISLLEQYLFDFNSYYCNKNGHQNKQLMGNRPLLRKFKTFDRESSKKHKYQKDILTADDNYQGTQHSKRFGY